METVDASRMKIAYLTCYNLIVNLYKFTAVLTPVEENSETYYQVRVPALPEIVTFGDTIEEATFMAQDALELVVLSRLEEKEGIPLDKKPSRINQKSIVKEVLVSVVHNVNALPLTQDVKIAFA